MQLKDGCVQKVPREWLSLSDGCRGDGTIQALLDTGSSLMMGPMPIVQFAYLTLHACFLVFAYTGRLPQFALLQTSYYTCSKYIVCARPHATEIYRRDETDLFALSGVSDFVADYEIGEMVE